MMTQYQFRAAAGVFAANHLIHVVFDVLEGEPGDFKVIGSAVFDLTVTDPQHGGETPVFWATSRANSWDFLPSTDATTPTPPHFITCNLNVDP